MLAALFVAAALQAPVMPNPVFTPGAIRPLTAAQICQINWGRDDRKVTVAMKKQVAAAYGLKWEDRGTVEFDHLIPRSLGGSDSVLNLWPMCCIQNGRIVGPAHEKDVREVRTWRLVCAGKMSLASWQSLFPAMYRAVVVP